MATIPDPTDRGGGAGAGAEDDDSLGPLGGSDSLVHGGASDNGPLVCAFKGVGDALAGALMGSVFGFGTGLFKKQGFKVALREGGGSAKTFALLSGVHSLVACYLRRVRGVEDALNAGIAGCATGLALSTPGTPQALLQSCVSFGVFSYILENINKPRAALAVPLSSTTAISASSSTKSRRISKRNNNSIQERWNFFHSMRELALAPVHVLPPFTLPPPAMFAAPFSLSHTAAVSQRSSPLRHKAEGPL